LIKNKLNLVTRGMHYTESFYIVLIR